MAENSKIEWTDHTLNFWEGCQKVSPGCDNCYAEAFDKRCGKARYWGPGADRRRTKPANWNQAYRWHRQADRLCIRYRVFSNSKSDFFDNVVDPSWRADAWRLIRDTDCLTWLLLTKRIGNVADMLPAAWGPAFRHVKIGVSIVNQEEADRDIPKAVALRWPLFVSYEPALGPVNFMPWMPHISEIFVGGESGAKSKVRGFDLRWAHSIIEQCDAAGVPVFIKQLGARPYVSPTHDGATGYFLALEDKKGGNPEEWPEHLRRRELPG